jgi:sodium/glucose cotransporter 1/sodium/glucose cotransporter 9
MSGLVIGMIRFGLEFGYTIPACGSLEEDPRPEFVKRAVGDIHFLHFGCILFVIVCIVTITISLLTEPIPKVHVSIKCLLHKNSIIMIR